jgi:hypothetical protein
MGEAMTTHATDPSATAAAARENSPATRLLDMLVGWANFVDESQSEPDSGVDDCVSSEEIAALYQQAGAEWLTVDESDIAGENAMVRRFVEERVLPLLLRGRH